MRCPTAIRTALAAAIGLFAATLPGCMQPDETGVIKADPGAPAAKGEGRFAGATPEGKTAPKGGGESGGR